MMVSICTASVAPQSPGPTSTGSGWNAAILASRNWQADGFAGAAAAADSGSDAKASCGGANCCGMTTGNGRVGRCEAGAALARLAAVAALSCAAAVVAAPNNATMTIKRITRIGLGHLCGSIQASAGCAKRGHLRYRRAGLTSGDCGRPRSTKHRLREANVMLGLMQDWPLLCHRIIDH